MSQGNSCDKFTMTTHLYIKSYFLSTTDPVECSLLIIWDLSCALILSTKPLWSNTSKVVVLTHHFNGPSPSALTEHIHYTIIVISCSKNNCIFVVLAPILFSLHFPWRSRRCGGHTVSKEINMVLAWQMSLVFVNFALTLSGQVQFKLG